MEKRLTFVLVFVVAMAFFIGGCGVQSEDTHFYFVQIADTHFGELDGIERTEKVVKAMNQLPMPIECVVHTGDIMQDTIEDEEVVLAGKAALKDVKVPIHFVSGNHDVLPKKLQPTVNAYRKHFGELYSKAEYNGVVFLFVYTEPLVKGFEVDGIDVLKWVEASLQEAKGKPVIIFHHNPSSLDFYSNKFHNGWSDDMRAKWQKLVNSYNVKAVIAGHYHRAGHSWLGDVPLYICPPVSGYWGRQNTYRIYEYNNGKIGYWTRQVD